MSGKLAWRYNANGDMESGPYTVTQWLGYYFATFELDGYDTVLNGGRFGLEPCLQPVATCKQNRDVWI